MGASAYSFEKIRGSMEKGEVIEHDAGKAERDLGQA